MGSNAQNPDKIFLFPDEQYCIQEQHYKEKLQTATCDCLTKTPDLFPNQGPLVDGRDGDSERYMGSQLHHRITRQSKELHHPARVSTHRREQLFPPTRHTTTGIGHHGFAAEEVSGLKE